MAVFEAGAGGPRDGGGTNAAASPSPRTSIDVRLRWPYAPALAGAVAQMGERCNRTAEVRGSIPLSSTRLFHSKPAREVGLVKYGSTPPRLTQSGLSLRLGKSGVSVQLVHVCPGSWSLAQFVAFPNISAQAGCSSQVSSRGRTECRGDQARAREAERLPLLVPVRGCIDEPTHAGAARQAARA